MLIVKVVPSELRVGNPGSPTVSPAWSTIGHPANSASSSLLASGGGGRRGWSEWLLTAPRSRGTAGSVPISWGLEDTTRPISEGQVLHFQQGDLGFRDFLESSFLFGKWNGQGCQCWFRAHGDQGLRPQKAKGQSCASAVLGSDRRPIGTGLASQQSRRPCARPQLARILR